MVFKFGKYNGITLDEVVKTDPQYIKWLYEFQPMKKNYKHPMDEVREFLHNNKNIIEEIDKNFLERAESYTPFIEEINKFIFLSSIYGSRRGQNFLQSVKSSLSQGKVISRNSMEIVIDIISRGEKVKPLRRNSKKYKEKKEHLWSVQKIHSIVDF